MNKEELFKYLLDDELLERLSERIKMKTPETTPPEELLVVKPKLLSMIENEEKLSVHAQAAISNLIMDLSVVLDSCITDDLIKFLEIYKAVDEVFESKGLNNESK